ncbi:beta-lactamase family protein [Chryseobacterium sp. RG1]|uniref:Beta-lactamase family protein n=1 Tax=Chryseobacterium tagetis TaxID=2801334 RepID=A0ABS8A513_9FLAO|nr:serine hydrolase domain-containing protein [Chryseobacterium tagetis]MCA6067801.1 beta-lactamase family protein [Chryseobacterium tagetis]
MKKIFTLVFLILVLPLIAQKNIKVRHLDGKTTDVQIIQKRLERLVDSAKIAGLQVAIVNRNKVIYSSSFGYKDIENKKKLNDSTVMYAASLTKPVSAYIFMRLVDKGIFSLDQPVYKYLKKPIGEYPKWKDLAEDATSVNLITPRMLLSHSAGLPVLRQLYNNKVTLIANPGEKFYYSNEGINLLGFMIEEYMGKKLEDIAREEVFGPLHMTHTSMVWENKFEVNFSNAYFKDGKKYGSERRESSRAAGSMSTTANDYANFMINLMKKKGLASKSYLEMLKPQIMVKSKRGFGPLKDSITNENDTINLAWGLGVGLFDSPFGKAFFHTGHGDANQNYAVAFPESGTAVVILSNSENFEKNNAQILKLCSGDTYSPLRWLGHLDTIPE